MKKSMKHLILCFAVLAGCLMVGNAASAKKIPVDSKHFPDKKVLSAVKKEAKGKKYVETDDVKVLYIKGAANVKGLGYFTKLTDLNLDSYKGTSITLKNQKLVYLTVSGKKVKKVNLTKVKDLKSINMWNAGLTQITGLKNKAKLKWVFLSGNNLKKLDLSGCKKLEDLDASDNRITSLNISGCANIKWFRVNGNIGLSSVNVSKCKKLQHINVGYTGISALNLGSNKKLTSLYCYNTKVSSLNIPSKVTILGAYNNNMTYYQLPNHDMFLDFEVVQSGSQIPLANYIGTGYTVSQVGEDIYYDPASGIVTVYYSKAAYPTGTWIQLTNGYRTYDIHVTCY